MFSETQMADLMKKAQDIELNLKQSQNEINHIIAEGIANDKTIKVIMNGTHTIQDVTINPTIIGDTEKLKLAFISAVNDANKKIEDCITKKIMALTPDMKPANFSKYNIPF